MRFSLAALALGALAGVAALPVPARAQSVADRADVRCILVLGVVRDEKQREAAARGVYFFLGKVNGRGLGPRLQSMLESEGTTISQAAQVQAELTRCGAELQQKTNDMQAAYRNLQAAHPQAPAPKAAPPTK